jgi:hypothetical protein
MDLWIELDLVEERSIPEGAVQLALKDRREIGDLSRERESSEQFVWYGETEMQLRRWAMMPSMQAAWSPDEEI